MPSSSFRFAATARDIAIEADRHSRRDDEHVFDLCEGTIDIVAALFNVSSKEIRRPGRGDAGVARMRQVGMYVAHVALGLSMRDIGRGFGRDRTTVLYACHLIEDLRDDPEFDNTIHRAERVVQAAMANRKFA